MCVAGRGKRGRAGYTGRGARLGLRGAEAGGEAGDLR